MSLWLLLASNGIVPNPSLRERTGSEHLESTNTERFELCKQLGVNRGKIEARLPLHAGDEEPAGSVEPGEGPKSKVQGPTVKERAFSASGWCIGRFLGREPQAIVEVGRWSEGQSPTANI